MDTETSRRLYFQQIDTIAEMTGNSKEYIHDYWKHRIFPFLYENPDNFTEDSRSQEDPTCSTKQLSEQGWSTFYTEFKHWVIETFNI